MDKKAIIIVVSIIGLLVLSITLNRLNQTSSTQDLFETPISEEQTTSETIIVDLKGAVLNPGVYKLSEGTRMYQLIERAGGFNDQAVSININMSQRLYDQMIIYIPSINLDVDAPVFDDDAGLISISTADQATLESLPNIGASTALNIINYRNEFGPFETIEDIINVTNIGPATYDQIKDLIRP